jgi:hypothetical protein
MILITFPYKKNAILQAKNKYKSWIHLTEIKLKYIVNK